MNFIQETRFEDLPMDKPRKSEINFDEIIPKLSAAYKMLHSSQQVWVEMCLSLAQKIEELEEKIKLLQS